MADILLSKGAQTAHISEAATMAVAVLPAGYVFRLIQQSHVYIYRASSS